MAVVALAGGVGGAKLALGLARRLPMDDLTIVVNTGDDFEHLGLRIAPDLDTVMYTLAGLANSETGWGLAGETWNFMEAVARLGGDAWFRLGDRDLATHVERTRRLRNGEPLSEITAEFCRRLRVGAEVIPMTDDPVYTIVHTAAGPLPFQEYFVRRGCEPPVQDFEFLGLASARPLPRLLERLADAEQVIYCPSNPYVSLAPILNLPGLRPMIEARRAAGVPVVAVSPIVAGSALKGPAAKMMTELGLESSVTALAGHYGGTIDGFVIDRADSNAAERIESSGIQVLVTATVMKSESDKVRLAGEVVEFGRRLARGMRGRGGSRPGP